MRHNLFRVEWAFLHQKRQSLEHLGFVIDRAEDIHNVNKGVLVTNEIRDRLPLNDVHKGSNQLIDLIMLFFLLDNRTLFLSLLDLLLQLSDKGDSETLRVLGVEGISHDPSVVVADEDSLDYQFSPVYGVAEAKNLMQTRSL